MKKTILALSLLVTAVASAQIDPRRDFQNPPVLRPIGERQLICANDRTAKQFTATLDEGSFEPGHGLFHTLDARIRDNYYTADQMVCNGNRLNEVVCIGFVNGSSNHIIEVSLKQKSSNATVVASYRMLRGQGPTDTLRCRIEE